MPVAETLEPAGSYVVAGLSCQLSESAGMKELVRQYFSPPALPELPVAESATLPLNLSETVISLFRSACLDAQINQIPENTAIFLCLDNNQDKNKDVTASLQAQVSAAFAQSLKIIVLPDTSACLNEALNRLDSGECPLALVAAVKAQQLSPAAAILLSSADTARSRAWRTYAGLKKANQTVHQSRAGLLSLATAEWLSSSQPAKNWQAMRRACQKNRADTATPGEDWSDPDPFCYVLPLALELSAGSTQLSGLFALINASLALHLRVIPAAGQYQVQLQGAEQLAQSKTARPWIHPVSPAEPAQPRRAFVDTGTSGYLLSEPGDDIQTISSRALTEQSSELFIFSGKTHQELSENMARLAADFFLQEHVPPAELAYRQNCPGAPDGEFKLALVACNRAELHKLMQEAIYHLQVNPGTALIQVGAPGADQSFLSGRTKPGQTLSRSTGIYYAGRPATKPGRMVFVFPGLGAAYPQMLADLCFYFPEVRQVFDFVERLALKAGDKIIPSRTIFPLADRSPSSGQAMLATMDSSVVTLLLAEWALYILLKNAGVSADILLGCSTGEFAALTICEAVNIFQSAETFYKLSTHVSRSIPLDELSQLRSVRVTAPYKETLAPLLSGLQKDIYVSADLSPSCVLLSGQKTAVDELCKLMRENQIDYLLLPVAIPYHTPLVSGKISEADIRQLKIELPQQEAWSCSIAGKYPDDTDKLRTILIDLFEKPIRLRATIESLYESGARIFVEVGPRGGLVPYISEILKDKEHLALAANLSGKSGIDQFHGLLAVLACHGISMNLKALYQRRLETDLPPLETALTPEPPHRDHMEAGSLALLCELEQINASLPPHFFDPFKQGGMTPEVMVDYLASMQNAHATLLQRQEQLLHSFLRNTTAEAGGYSQPESIRPAFLPGELIRQEDNCWETEFCLSTTRQTFLLDHAIGGSTTSVGPENRVCLVPLMVTLEIMAEGAGLLFAGRRLSRLREIRALKRIRTGKGDLRLCLRLRVTGPDCVEACIYATGKDSSPADELASCLIEFGQLLPEAPVPASPARQDSRPSRLSPHNLYGKDSMFHGPTMQSVQSIDCVSRRSIEGRISCRKPVDWFAAAGAPQLVIDPLLLDNASQFVLYQMYEHDLPATALLPFYTGSIEFFQGYENLSGKAVFASAYLRSMSRRGTEAQIELVDPDGHVVARINDISSRAIMLETKLSDFVLDPSRLLCTSVKMAGAGKAVIACIDRADMPDDETILDWLTDYILTESEQNEWRRSGKTEKRRLEKLMGRLAAKDAVRLILAQEFGIVLKAGDIEIQQSPSGHVEVFLQGIFPPWIPQISISHCSKAAVALAEPPQAGRLSGIDLEEIVERESGFAELAFTPAELKWLESKPAAQRALHTARLWTAKESAAKACGSGLSGNPRLFEMEVESSADSTFNICARLEKSGQASTYKCLVSTETIADLSLAIVVGSS